MHLIDCDTFRKAASKGVLLGGIGRKTPNLRLWAKASRRGSEPLHVRNCSLNGIAVQDVSEREMSKRVDFAKERRSQGRSLSGAVRELVALIQPLANQQGIDLQARLNEA